MVVHLFTRIHFINDYLQNFFPVKISLLPCCAEVSASISVEGPLSAVGAPLCELGDVGTEGGAEVSGAACTKEE